MAVQATRADQLAQVLVPLAMGKGKAQGTSFCSLTVCRYLNPRDPYSCVDWPGLTGTVLCSGPLVSPQDAAFLAVSSGRQSSDDHCLHRWVL